MVKMQSHQSSIIDYYDTCESDYRTFWDLDRSMAMHAGFRDHTTSSLSDALARENEILADYAKIKSHEKVLDAGLWNWRKQPLFGEELWMPK